MSDARSRDDRGAPRGRDWETYVESLAVFGMRPGLDRVAALLEALGHPERAFRAIHVVGTNGKSSTTRYAAAILRAAGLKAGAYLSPHIAGFNERVQIDGESTESVALDYLKAKGFLR